MLLKDICEAQASALSDPKLTRVSVPSLSSSLPEPSLTQK